VLAVVLQARPGRDEDELAVVRRPARAQKAPHDLVMRARMVELSRAGLRVNCWDGRADAPNFNGRIRSVMSVDIPQGRDLQITRVHLRWGMANIPRIGRVRFRWTKDLPVGNRVDKSSTSRTRPSDSADPSRTLSGCSHRCARFHTSAIPSFTGQLRLTGGEVLSPSLDS
jgi:hypothetical protein